MFKFTFAFILVLIGGQGVATDASMQQACMEKQRQSPMHSSIKSEAVEQYCSCYVTEMEFFLNNSATIQSLMRSRNKAAADSYFASAEFQNQVADMANTCLARVTNNGRDTNKKINKKANIAKGALTPESRKSAVAGFVGTCTASLTTRAPYKHYKHETVANICRCAGEKVVEKFTYQDVQDLLDPNSQVLKRALADADNYASKCSEKITSR